MVAFVEPPSSVEQCLQPYTSLVLGFQNEKTTCRKSWSVKLLQVSNLTFDPCFKVMWRYYIKKLLYFPDYWF